MVRTTTLSHDQHSAQPDSEYLHPQNHTNLNMTRVANADPEYMTNLIAHNRDIILPELDRFETEFAHVKALVKTYQTSLAQGLDVDQVVSDVVDYVSHAREIRSQMPAHPVGNEREAFILDHS